MVEIGKKYKTVGEWDALVIYINFDKTIFWAIHAPGTPNESNPILHQMNGTAITTFSVSEPPRYGKLHPADILINQEVK